MGCFFHSSSPFCEQPHTAAIFANGIRAKEMKIMIVRNTHLHPSHQLRSRRPGCWWNVPGLGWVVLLGPCWFLYICKLSWSVTWSFLLIIFFPRWSFFKCVHVTRVRSHWSQHSALTVANSCAKCYIFKRRCCDRMQLFTANLVHFESILEIALCLQVRRSASLRSALPLTSN